MSSSLLLLQISTRWMIFNDVLLAGVGQVISGWDVGVNGIILYIFAFILLLNTVID